MSYLLDTNTCVYAIKRWPAVIGRPQQLSAVSRGQIVVTHNVGEFRRVPGIAVEDWV